MKNAQAKSTELVTVRLDQLVKIEPEDVDKIISIADKDVTWLKVSDAGFSDNSFNVTPRLMGIIIEMTPYWIKFDDDNLPDRIPFVTMDDQPEGYKLRTDLRIHLPVTGEIVGLSLATSSSRIFSKYVNMLAKMRLGVQDVITVFTVRPVSTKKGVKYTVVEFSHIPKKEKVEEKEDVPPVEVYQHDLDAVIETDDAPPF